jgi:hypothetical protein
MDRTRREGVANDARTRWDAADRAALAARGIAVEEAERQLAVMSRPAAWAEIERPCTLGDGIARLDAASLEASLEAHSLAARSGRVSVFVPASGAATRMFKDLLAARERPGPLAPAEVRADGSAPARALARFVDELPRFAFAGALGEQLSRRGRSLDALRRDGPWRPLVDAFLDPDGLDAARAPKGLLAFHREGDEVHTAFEEHLVEACALAGDEGGVRRLDVTVSPEHREGFERVLAERTPALAARHGGGWRVRFSEQDPATDTIAAEPGGGPFRDESGRLVFRPAGHGALLRNLAATGGDLVFLRNIDNVAVERLRAESEGWGRALLGHAARLAADVRTWCEALEAREPGAVEGARGFAREALGLALPSGRDAPELAAELDRPVRVCGMVPNTGEPGGGPFWVRGGNGLTRQIVESAQVDMGSPERAAAFRAATHFNPVFLAVSLRDRHGRPHDLARFVDEAAVIVTRKSHEGRELLALERPGLWNGAMAGWHTVFVEVPLAVFNPVKTVFDLLRPEHQGEP